MTTSPESNIWPEHLDALVAAPDHHRLLLENDSVRVLDTIIQPGATVPMHTHRWPAVYYIISTGDFVRRNVGGAVVFDSRSSTHGLHAGQSVWALPMPPHTLENVGVTPIHVISIEVKAAVR